MGYGDTFAVLGLMLLLTMAVEQTVGLRQANQDFSALVEQVAKTGQAILVTRRGAPIVRITPVEGTEGSLTTEQRAALSRLLDEKLPMEPWDFDRDAIYDR